jgi:hypothetical protein
MSGQACTSSFKVACHNRRVSRDLLAVACRQRAGAALQPGFAVRAGCTLRISCNQILWLGGGDGSVWLRLVGCISRNASSICHTHTQLLATTGSTLVASEVASNDSAGCGPNISNVAVRKPGTFCDMAMFPFLYRAPAMFHHTSWELYHFFKLMCR